MHTPPSLSFFFFFKGSGAPRVLPSSPTRPSPDRGGTLPRAKKRGLETAGAPPPDPRLLLLDEAMSGLTPAETAAAVELVRRIHGELGLALCVVEHVMEVVMPLSQRVVVLDDGEKIAAGPPAAGVRNDAGIKGDLRGHY